MKNYSTDQEVCDAYDIIIKRLTRDLKRVNQKISRLKKVEKNLDKDDPNGDNIRESMMRCELNRAHLEDKKIKMGWDKGYYKLDE